MRLFEKGALRQVLGTKGDEVKGRLRKLHKQNLIIGFVMHMARVKEYNYSYTASCETPKERDHLINIGVDETIR